jgi:hypothetical protein
MATRSQAVTPKFPEIPEEPIVSRDHQDTRAVGHADVLALTYDAESGFLHARTASR